MTANDTWYVKSPNGKVFGPIGFETLKTWVKDGRVEPLAGISHDLTEWKLAPLEPALEMNWIVENNPGQFYGPTHRAVIDDLIKTKVLSQNARFYQDGREAEGLRSEVRGQRSEVERRKVEIEGLKAEVERQKVEIEGLRSEVRGQRSEAERLRSEGEKLKDEGEKQKAKIAELHAQIILEEEQRRDLDAKIARLKEGMALLEKRDAPRPRVWRSEEVIEPEIVSDEPPPVVAHDVFRPETRGGSAGPKVGSSALEALEAQAQMELKRMGIKF